MKIYLALVTLCLISAISCNAINKTESYLKFLDNFSEILVNLIPKTENFKIMPNGDHLLDLNSMDRASLIKFAVHIENFLDPNRIGGVHDLIENMEKEDLILHLQDKAIRYNLNLKKIFENMNQASNFLEIPLKKNTNNIEDHKNQAIIRFIESLSNKDLKTFALNLEKEERQHQAIFGGIHDYIDSMSMAKIRKYVIDCLERRPDIKTVNQLKEFMNKIDLSVPCESSNINATNYFNGRILKQVSDAISSYIYSIDRETLIKILSALENQYKREEFKIDTLKDLQSQEIRVEILKFCELHAEEIQDVNDLKKLIN